MQNTDWAWCNLRFQIDIKNTVIFTGIFVLGCLVLGLFSALLLDQGLKGEGFFRSLKLFPGVILQPERPPAKGLRED